MAALNKRDIDLIFRAETGAAAKDIGVLGKSVDSLTKELDQQIAAAKRGEGSMEALQGVAKELTSTFASLKETTSAVAGYDKVSAALDKVRERAKAAEQAVEAQRAKMDGAKKGPSAAQTEQLEKRERAVAKLRAEETRLVAVLSEEEKTLERLGVDAKNFSAGQEQIARTALEAARAIDKANKAVEGYGASQKAADADKLRLADTAKFDDLAKGSQLPDAQIQFLRGLENAHAELKRAIDADRASLSAFNKEVRDQATSVAAGRVAFLTQELKELDAAAERVKAISGFQAIAAQAEAGARDVSRFGASADTAATSFNRLKDTVQGLVAPAQAAAQTLDGVLAQVAAAEATLANTKKLRPEQYSDAINQLAQANAGLVQQAGQVDGFRIQEAAVNSLAAELDRAAAEVLQLTATFDPAAANAGEMAAKIQQAEGSVERLGLAFGREKAKLDQLSAALKRAGIDTTKLDAEMVRITATADRAGNAIGRLQGKTSGKGALFGLKPHELTNLGYQINDIVVSLASGQKPLTVFAQQGAQIGQIIPGAFAKIFALLPQLIILGAVLGTVGAAFKRASDDARRLESAGEIIATTGGRANATAPQIAGLAKSLEDVGLKADEAKKLLRDLIAEGFDTSTIEGMIAAGENFVAVFGGELVDAIALETEAINGSNEDLLKYIDTTDVLTEAERAHIEMLLDSNRTEEARQAVINITRERLQELADNQNGPWSVAWNNLKAAYNSFVSALSRNKTIEGLRDRLRELAAAAVFVTGILAGKSYQQAMAEASAAAVGKTIGGGGKKPAPIQLDPNRVTEAGKKKAEEAAERLADARARTPAQKRERARVKAAKGAVGSQRERNEQIASTLAEFDEKLDQKNDKAAASAGKKAANKAAADAKRKKAEAERRAKQAAAEREREAKAILADEEKLENALQSLQAKAAKGATQTLEQRFAGIDDAYADLFEEIDEYEKRAGKGAKINGMSIAAYRAVVAEQIKILKNNDGIKKFEEDLTDLTKERAEKLAEVQDLLETRAIGPEEALSRSKTILDDMAVKMNELIRLALEYGEKLPQSPERDAFIAKFKTQATKNTGDQNAGAFAGLGKDAIADSETKLNSIIARRNELVSLQNTLVQLGLKTNREASREIAKAFAATEEPINKAVEEIERLLNVFEGNPAMLDFLDQMKAKLAGIKAEASFINPELVQFKNNVNGLIASGIIGFIDQTAAAFGRMIVGQQSVVDGLLEIGRAFLTMIAETLKAVAMLIIQALILDAVDKATGGILKPLLKIYSASINHDGGIAGSTGRHRNVNPLIFANAPRYHTGGIAGLSPDEVPAILRRGEEVLKETDPRHRLNGGRRDDAGGAAQSIRQVLAFGDDQVAGAMAGAAGEEVVVTHIRRNKAAIKQLLGN